MERRTFLGDVLATTLSANINNSVTSFSVVDGTTFPIGSSDMPYVIVVDRATVNEEKMLVSSRTANTLTIASRGYDGTTAVAHSSGASVDHVLDAVVLQDMNNSTYDNEVYIWLGV